MYAVRFEILIEYARTPVTQRGDQRMSGMKEHLPIAHHEVINRIQSQNDQ